MSVRPLAAEELEAWDRFVDERPDGTLFHTAWWHAAWGAELSVLARREDGGAIVAGIPIHISRHRGVRALRRPPLTPINGPLCAVAADAGLYARYTEETKRIEELLDACPRLGIYDFVLGPGQENCLPFLWNGFESRLRYNYVLPASARETWEAGLSTMIRRNLRKAREERQTNGYTLDTKASIEEIEPLLQTTSQEKEFALPDSRRLAAWWRAVRDRDAGSIYLLRAADGRPLCATLLVRDTRSAYYLAGGMVESIRRKSKANLLLFEEMIRDSHARGLDFDFEGSIIRGVEAFFRGWGAERHIRIRLIKIPSWVAYCSWALQSYRREHRTRW